MDEHGNRRGAVVLDFSVEMRRRDAVNFGEEGIELVGLGQHDAEALLQGGGRVGMMGVRGSK